MVKRIIHAALFSNRIIFFVTWFIRADNINICGVVYLK